MIPDEREWQAQEKAMNCERAGLDLPATDTLGVSYLPVARALGQPLEPLLPVDFAARVAAMAARGQQAGMEAESKLEHWLLLGLAAVFVISALAAGVIYGDGSWLGSSFSLLARLGAGNLAWPLALVACLVISWSAEALRSRASGANPRLA